MNILDIKEDKRISSHGKPHDINMFLRVPKAAKTQSPLVTEQAFGMTDETMPGHFPTPFQQESCDD